jgi:hypothetical protein
LIVNPTTSFVKTDVLKMDKYLDLARQGKYTWRRYVLAVAFILFMWQILGAIPSVFLLISGMINDQIHTITDAITLPGVNPLVSFVALMLGSVAFLLGLTLAMRFIHGRPLRTLITPARSISWGRLLAGFGLWFLLIGLTSILEALFYPGRYSLTFRVEQFIPYAILALVLIPIQTSAEELFFRGYILQGVGLRSRNIWLLSAISGFLFMAPHFLNPEASSNYYLMGIYYFSMGAFLAYITLREGQLELALGVHAANNLFSVLIANYTVSSLPSPSLFTVDVLDPIFSVPAALVGMGIFLWFFLGPFRRTTSKPAPLFEN